MRIDIVRSSLMGYKTVWEEREYLLKLALVPLIVKFVSTILIYAMEIELLSLRHVLCMVPSYIVEGWMIGQFLRTLMTGERWPMKIPKSPTKEHIGFMLWRTRGILGVILCFTLIMLIQGGMAVYMTDLKELLEIEPRDTPTASSFPIFIAALAMMFFTIWAFRLVWIYLPLAILMPMGTFLKEIKGIMTSVYMAGVWILSIVPVMFVVMVVSGLFGGGDGSLTGISGFLTIMLHVIGEVAAQLVAITAMTYAFKNILIKHGAKPIFSEPSKPF